jgi:hypothetical protein
MKLHFISEINNIIYNILYIMSYVEFQTDDKDNMKCNFSKDNKYYICTNRQQILNNNITMGSDYKEMLQGNTFHKSLNYAFNDITFANAIDSSNNTININNCTNNDDCKDKITFAKINKSNNDIFSIFNNLENPEKLNENMQRLNYICKEFNVCSYKSDNKFLLKKVCNDNVCKYDVYCECHKD